MEISRNGRVRTPPQGQSILGFVSNFDSYLALLELLALSGLRFPNVDLIGWDGSEMRVGIFLFQFLCEDNSSGLLLSFHMIPP